MQILEKKDRFQKLFKLKILRVLVLTFIFLEIPTPINAARVIDNFNGPCDTLGCSHRNNVNLLPNTSNSYFPNYGLGGEEDIYFYAYAENSSGLYGLITAKDFINLNQLILVSRTDIDNASTTGLSDGGFVNIIYDGNDTNNPVNNFGLANIDLTDSDTANIFRLHLATSTNADTVDLIVYTDSTNYSELLGLPIPKTSNGYKSIDILFSQFTDAGVSGGADFSNVTAIELQLNHQRTIGGAIFVNPFAVGYLLGIDNFATSTQLKTNISSSLEIDLNGDGDFDSTPDDGDTILYTVTLENTEDLQGLTANNVQYTASFDPDYAQFLPETVTATSSLTGLSKGTINLGNGVTDTSVDVSFEDILDNEIITITYQMKIDFGLHQTANINYEHFGTVVADEWPAYDLDSEVVNFNRFDVDVLMTAVGSIDADGDTYAGPSEQVTFTAVLENTGPNTIASLVFEQDPEMNASLIVGPGAVTTTKGTVNSGNSVSHTKIKVSATNVLVGEAVTITFKMLIDDPFFFGENQGIVSAQAIVTNNNQENFGLSDFDGIGSKDPTVVFVDAFPNNIYAALDVDGDALPDAWNESECDIELPAEAINSCESLSGLEEDTHPSDTDNNGTPNDPNNPLADDDGDSAPNGNDAFPFQCEANLDTDDDGMPDVLIFGESCLVQSAEDSQLIEDDDDDNDSILDNGDDFPTNNAADTDTDGDGQPDDWLESCNSTCQINSGLTLDNDDDNDLVIDSSDDFPLNNAASKDDDGDGFPDFWNASCNVTCQNDSGLTLDLSLNDFDNDSVIDAEDAFSEDCSASVDTDNDGQPNQFHDPLPLGCAITDLVEDTDDDGDAVLDNDDDFPLNIAASADEDQDGLPDAWDVNCNSTCQNNSGLTRDLFLNDTDNDGTENDPDNDAADDDGDGILNGEEEGFELIDNNPPVVTPPANRTVLASGDKTTVLLGFATATDYVQGVLVNLSQANINVDNKGPFAVGVHTITWNAVDAVGNVGSAIQIITVEENPDLEDDDDKSGGGGGGSLGLLSIVALMLFYARRKLLGF